MNRFIQLHTLISFPPSNLNRDELGRPKTAQMGGVERLRVSSQSLKRAWRTSDVFARVLASKVGGKEGYLGVRTKQLGVEVYARFKEADFNDKLAKECASKIAQVYGKLKAEKDKPFEIEQLVHVSPEEMASLDDLVTRLIAERREPTEEELDVLIHDQHAVDIGMFGRMLASRSEHNAEAAVQVAHALGIHASITEQDYFTAVDDLNKKVPTAHLDESTFASAVFYHYVCIDRALLSENLGGDEQLVNKAVAALVEAALTVAPTGKQNSFASRAYAHYALLEKGDRQPRNLSLAFLKPVTGSDYAVAGVDALRTLRDNMDKVYGPCASSRYEISVMTGEGTLTDLLAFSGE